MLTYTLFYFPGNLNKEKYLELLNEQLLPDLLPLLDANADIMPIFMQDGCPAHNGRRVVPWLDEYIWPARSPDLTIMDFFLWGYIKNLLYPVLTIEALPWTFDLWLRNSHVYVEVKPFPWTQRSSFECWTKWTLCVAYCYLINLLLCDKGC